IECGQDNSPTFSRFVVPLLEVDLTDAGRGNAGEAAQATRGCGSSTFEHDLLVLGARTGIVDRVTGIHDRGGVPPGDLATLQRIDRVREVSSHGVGRIDAAGDRAV